MTSGTGRRSGSGPILLVTRIGKESMTMQQIWRAIAVLVAGLLVTIIGLAAPTQAAQPDIIVEAATLLSPVELFVNGYATCSEPTGQAQIEVLALQFSGGNLPSGSGVTTINCDSAFGSWGVTITTSVFNPWHSGHLVLGNAQLIRSGVTEAMSCICVTAW
jgi:hypothetical protein